MKRSDISPIHGVDWKEGQSRKASSWIMVDGVNHNPLGNPGCQIREVFHYSTLMGRFVREVDTEGNVGRWEFQPISIGWGSVSDQQGMNDILRGCSGWYYSRKGGNPQYIN